MAEVRTGRPQPVKHKGRPPLWDDTIRCVAGVTDKYIHERNKVVKESIRRRAISLGFSVRTFAHVEGGWCIKIL